MDILVGFCLLLVSTPVIAVIALLIRMESRGPVFFVHPRLARTKWSFKCVKFRTMYSNSDESLARHLAQNGQAREEWARYRKLRGSDPRVTRVGKWLRRFSLGELPQLWNAVRGDMSLVGPRPYLDSELGEMGPYAEDILFVKPGLTGLWQVNDRNNIPFHKRLELEQWYANNWSLGLDVTLLAKPVLVVLRAKGAY